MTHTNTKSHWEQVYQTKLPDQLSWTQTIPETSLALIDALPLAKGASIIDVGGGESRLADQLLEKGFQNITVLDISAAAIEKSKLRLGSKANRVNWIVKDITLFKPHTTFDLWHDRAAFHFMTTGEQITRYLKVVRQCVTGYLTMATFSDKGPDQCSGLPVQRYTATSLAAQFADDFDMIHCTTEDHITPFNTTQNFLYCSFKRKGAMVSP